MPMEVTLPAALISRTVTPASSRPLKVRAFHSSHVRPSLLACAKKVRCSYMVLAVPIQILTRSRPTIGLTKALALSPDSHSPYQLLMWTACKIGVLHFAKLRLAYGDSFSAHCM